MLACITSGSVDSVSPERLEDRAELADRLIGAGDDLLGDRRAFLAVGVQQGGACLSLENRGQLPCNVEAVLDRGIGAKTVRWRMPVSCVAHDEDTARLHVRGVHVVDGPGRYRGNLRLQRLVADQVAHHLGGKGVVDNRFRAVDVVAPDDKPFVPGPDHPHKTHADAADIGAGLHHPVEHRGAVGDILAQIRLENDVHRAADAHLSFERQLFQLGHLGIAAISPEQVFRPDGDLLAGEAVQAGGGHAIGILFMAADTPSTSAPGCRASRQS
jgi:hypothetical protein